MADQQKEEMLREMARNRGCKLVKSRRRKPGTGDFGRYGLRDARTDAEILGFGKEGLTATAEEIEAHLRGSMVATWKSSLKASGGKPKSSQKSGAKQADPKPVSKRAVEANPKAGAKPEAPAERPALRIRDADSVDAEAMASLIAELGFETDADAIADRLIPMIRDGEPPLLAKLGDEVLGCLTWHVTPVIHRPHPVGRITMLIVTERSRRHGVGRALVEKAEARMRDKGCRLVEVTSNEKLKTAHRFYQELGYERTSHRFARSIA